MRLFETIGRFLGRVEVVLAGAEDAFRAGEEALSSGDAMRARAMAHVVLARLPGSPLGLALLADACESAGLDAELAMTLEELASRFAAQAEVWVRLARARARTLAGTDDVRDAYVRALAVAEPGSEARREALFGLADLDLAQGDGARAEIWLDRLPRDKTPMIATRRAEARLLQNDVTGARAHLDGVEDDPIDGRVALVRGKIFALLHDPAAFAPLVRAYLLEEPGASELLSSTLAWVPVDEATRERIRLIVAERGEAGLTRWRAAFARAAGKRDEARAALREALGAGDRGAARPLLEAALDDRDHDSLLLALAAIPIGSDGDPVVDEARRLPSPVTTPEAAAREIALLSTFKTDRVKPWADALLADRLALLLPATGSAAWTDLLARLDAHARALHDLNSIGDVAELGIERRRPVRLAIVGEFNAGKSTFINALIGADVAPTGVLPTTATLHHLRYGPDPIARILFEGGHEPPERIVPHDALRATLKGLGEDDHVRRVELVVPLPSLTRVEIIDTPGFNAPDVRHAAAARGAFDEADVVLWLLDGGQPLKQSERVVLEEAKAAGLPVQVLVNKIDRLDEAGRLKVLEMVTSSLCDIGIESLVPPLGVSARLALAGKLGDDAKLAASGWSGVQALLDEAIIGRSAQIKERALRRRMAGIVRRLVAVAAGVRAESHQREGAWKLERAAYSELAASLDRDVETLAKDLEKALAPALRAWQKDLDLAATGRDDGPRADEPLAFRYRVDRALAHLGKPLADALAATTSTRELTRTSAAALLPSARAVVRSFAAADGARTGAGLARAAIATLAEFMAGLALAPAPVAASEATWVELEAWGRVLG